jgi:hypothetical protein
MCTLEWKNLIHVKQKDEANICFWVLSADPLYKTLGVMQICGLRFGLSFSKYARGKEGSCMLCSDGVLKIKRENVFSVSCFMCRVAESEACTVAAF